MVIIDKEKCIGCGKCITDCVARNLEFVDNKANVKGACLQCGHCVAICKSDAVTIPEYDMDDVEIVDLDNKINPNLLLKCIKSRRSIRDHFRQWFFSASKVSSLISCSILQASSMATFSLTPIFIRHSVSKL